MRWLPWAGAALFAGGLALLAVALSRGEAVVFLVLIVPVIQANGAIGVAAIAALFGGLFLFFASAARFPIELLRSLGSDRGAPAPPARVEPGPPPQRSRTGGVLFLGPFPIIFGSDPQVARWMVILAVALFGLLVAFWVAFLL